MNLNGILGALFLAVFTNNAVLINSSGLDSAERFTRTRRRAYVYALYIAAASVISDAVVFFMCGSILPRFGIASSTLTDGVTALLSALFTAEIMDIAARRFAPRVIEALGGEALSVGYNSAVLGIVLLCRDYSQSLEKSIAYCIIFSLSTALTYLLVSQLRGEIREHRLPKVFSGAPIIFILLGLTAMVMLGYAGVSFPA